MSTPAKQANSTVEELESLDVAIDGMPTKEERAAADAVVKKYLMDNCKVMDSQFQTVLGGILHALSERSTSKKVQTTHPEWVKMTVGTSVITVGDEGFLAALNTAPSLARFPNKARVWAGSHQEDYIRFYRKYQSKLASKTGGLKGGLQDKHKIVRADFLRGGAGLELEEQAALAHYRNHMLTAGDPGSAHNPVSLYQLGSGK